MRAIAIAKFPANSSTVNTYISSPKDNKNPDKAILFLSDIFGIYTNAQLIADEFANNGYLTVIPDLFQGDQIDVKDMDSGNVNMPAWFPQHQPDKVDPVVESTLKYIRETLGVKKVGAVGYCFGGKVSSLHVLRFNIAIGQSSLA